MLARTFSSFRKFHQTAVLYEIALKMPSLSPTMASGTIVKWMKSEGDELNPGDLLCEVQTDKAVMGMEVDEEGILAKILVKANELNIPVGKTIAILAETGEDWQNIKIPDENSKSLQQSTDILKSEPIPKKSNILGPAVKLMLQYYGIDRSRLIGTGPKGTILKRDVLKLVTDEKWCPKIQKTTEKASVVDVKKPSLSSEFDIPLSNMRKTIANRLTKSKIAIPHAYACTSINMNSLISLKSQLKADGFKLSFNDFIVKSAANALNLVPQVNVQYINDTVLHMNTIDVSVAVATDNGLITPIIKDAYHSGVSDISTKMRKLITKAKDNKLQLDEFQGGTFTVSNLGMFGISHFTAIINAPQSAILAIGQLEPTVSTDLTVDNIMHVTLCFDNRAITESDSIRFLSEFKSGLEYPDVLLLGVPIDRLNLADLSST